MNCFRLDFVASEKFQKQLLCVCICIQKNNFTFTKNCFYAKVEDQASTRRQNEIADQYTLKVQPLSEKVGVMNLLQPLTSSVMNFLLEDYQKSWNALLKNDKSNIHLVLWNLPFHFIHWLNLMMRRIWRLKKLYSCLMIYHWNLIM